MLNIKADTIFSKFPFIASDRTEKDKEVNRISYWLEKLHVQKEEQSKTDTDKKRPHGLSSKKDQDFVQSGINEHTKNTASKKEDDRKTVNDLVRKSNRCIISISSLFPWSFFPNTIDVEESRVTFKFNQLGSSQSHSVDIKDISNVFIESSLFFATLQVVSRTYIQNDIKVGNLNKSKAQKVQRIIEGLRTFAENNIDTSNYEINELISKIEELHTAHNAS